METNLIASQETLALRHQVLRPHQSIQDCIYPDDNSENTFHVGGYHQGVLVGVATFLAEAHPDFQASRPFRLRGMATHHSLHGQGVGRKVLSFGIHEVQRRGGDFLWCNARESAFGFYQKLDLQLHGELFEIQGIGPHKVMYKYL